MRSSYATWKFQAYNQGHIFKQLNEEEFLDTLAKIMNTSAEQLKATYIACRELDSNYDRVMTEVHRMFEVEREGPLHRLPPSPPHFPYGEFSLE